MRIVSLATLWFGIIVGVAAIGVAIWGGWIAYWHYATLSTGRSAEFDNPLVQLAAGGAGLLLGGFLAGMGVGLTSKHPKPEGTTPVTE
jgi:fructose-specific phosphotransferase system IIC component